MTFSLVGRCAETGMFGVVVTSSSVCVASRCAWARGGVGAAATQNITDPRLGKLGLDLLQQGHGAASAMAQMVAAGRFPRISPAHHRRWRRRGRASFGREDARHSPRRHRRGLRRGGQPARLRPGAGHHGGSLPRRGGAAHGRTAAGRRRGGARGRRGSRAGQVGRDDRGRSLALADRRPPRGLARRADRRAAPGLGDLPAADGGLSHARAQPRPPRPPMAFRAIARGCGGSPSPNGVSLPRHEYVKFGFPDG